MASKKGDSPLPGGALNPAYWRLEVIKAEMFKMIPKIYKVVLVGSGNGRDAFYFPSDVDLTMEGLTVNFQDLITTSGGQIPFIKPVKSMRQIEPESMDVVVTAGDFARVSRDPEQSVDKWLSDIDRVLKPDGTILFLEPAEVGLINVLTERYPNLSLEIDRENVFGLAKFEYGTARLNKEIDPLDKMRNTKKKQGFGNR
eukprot:CAMPEP_0167743382 /NCGR_PEP_ID=MMETSP0110_2-20121227/1987_1 /TAXON_ID=629695 /ORGANISM="Gymnochlora sp., Strain CCMP2014" /LENGTH=198 /DNA_ID=CAMNT_0007627751 /DNA_START=181 /DNA_END=777 /DNA_ORIENTATION=-